MSIKTLIFIFFLLVTAVFLSVGRFYILPTYYPQLLKSNAPQPIAEASPSPTPDFDPEVRESLRQASVSAQLLQKLTPRQKVAQLLAIPITVSSDSAVLDQFNEAPGVFTLFGSNISALTAEKQIQQLHTVTSRSSISKSLPVMNYQEEKLLQPYVAVDHEGGSVQRLKGEGITTVPSAEEQCKLSDDELSALSKRVAIELRGLGVNIIYGPVIDLAEKQPILGSRICSSDPEKVISYAQTWITALQPQKVMPVIKHYPGIGQTTVDLHKQATVIDFNPREHSVFVALLKKFPYVGVMTSHVKVRMDSSVATASSDLKPCTFSSQCLDLISGEEVQSLRFTDALEMGSAQVTASGSGKTVGSLADLSVEALLAGHTVLVYGPSVKPTEINQIISRLSDEYQRSSEVRKAVDQAVIALWKTKFVYYEPGLE